MLQEVKKRLAPIIRRANNVFTHNPWGEYGHEGHVLVHRAVTGLARKHGKSVWYVNYASNWSEQLMRRYLDDCDRPIFSAATNAASLEAIADIYRENGAWTWFDGINWFAEEIFIRGPLYYEKGLVDEPPVPVNLLRVPDRAPPRKAAKSPAFRRYLRRFTGGWMQCVSSA